MFQQRSCRYGPLQYPFKGLILETCADEAPKDWKRLRKVYRTGRGCRRTTYWKQGGNQRNRVKKFAPVHLQRLQATAVAGQDDEQVENVTCDGCNLDTTELSFLTADGQDFCEECLLSRGLEGVEQSNGVTIVKKQKKQVSDEIC